MSLIFDRFPSIEHAEAFTAAVKERFDLEAKVFATRDGAQAHDAFPWALGPPIVHVEPPDVDDLTDDAIVAAEERVAAFVKAYGGTFCGTGVRKSR